MQIAIKTLIHDFNNDLTIINGIIILTEKVLNRGGTIDEVKTLINKLKDKINYIKSDLKDMVSSDQEIDLEKYLIENKKVLEEDFKIEISSKSSGKFPLKTTPGKLNRFVKNVIKNAAEAKATHVDFYMTSNYFLIKDNGNGIPRNILKQIGQNLRISTKKGRNHGYGIFSLKEFCNKHDLSFQINNSHTSSGAQITIKNNHNSTSRVAS